MTWPMRCRLYCPRTSHRRLVAFLGVLIVKFTLTHLPPLHWWMHQQFACIRKQNAFVSPPLCLLSMQPRQQKPAKTSNVNQALVHFHGSRLRSSSHLSSCIPFFFHSTSLLPPFSSHSSSFPSTKSTQLFPTNYGTRRRSLS